MNLIARFIDFKDWPTCRKTVLLAGLLALLHASIIPVMFLSGHGGGVADIEALYKLFTLPALIAGLVCLVSLVPVVKEQDGRWTAYLLIVTYGSWIALLVISLGLWSTPLESWVVLSVIVVTMWYDLRVGMVGMVFSLLWTAVIVAGVLSGMIPYAPIFVERSLDAQASPEWAALMMTLFLAMYIYGFGLLALNLAAQGRLDARLAQAQALIRRYLPTHLADRIEAGEHEAEARPVRQKLTIFFSDIVGFTHASDELDPEELADVLNEYLSEMADIAEQHGASINQMAGDGIMLLFGAPVYTSDEDHACRAVQMALAMQQRLRELRSSWMRHGLHSPLEARMGINTGYVSVGDFGSAGRKTYTAIGMQANIAARIQAQCVPGKVLMSESTWVLVKDKIRCDARGELKLKGVHYPVPTYEVRNESADPPVRAKVTAIHAS